MVDDVPQSVRKRARLAAQVACDYGDIESEDEENWSEERKRLEAASAEYWSQYNSKKLPSPPPPPPPQPVRAHDWSDIEDELDDETKALLEELGEMCYKSHDFYSGDGDFNLRYNQCELFDKAFQLAAARLFLNQAHGLKLAFHNGGAYGESGEDATEEMLCVVHASSTVCMEGGIDLGRGGVNVPWGCAMKAIPETDMTAVRDNIKRVMNEFGFRPMAETVTGGHIQTIASGGWAENGLRAALQCL